MNKQEITNAKNWATQFHNKEVYETRHKMCISSLSTQINQIAIEERRLLDSYKQSLKKVQSHRLNCEEDLIKMHMKDKLNGTKISLNSKEIESLVTSEEKLIESISLHFKRMVEYGYDNDFIETKFVEILKNSTDNLVKLSR